MKHSYIRCRLVSSFVFPREIPIDFKLAALQTCSQSRRRRRRFEPVPSPAIANCCHWVVWHVSGCVLGGSASRAVWPNVRWCCTNNSIRAPRMRAQFLLCFVACHVLCVGNFSFRLIKREHSTSSGVCVWFRFCRLSL